MKRALVGLFAGMLAAMAFPFAIPGVGNGPLLEWLPRELLVVVGAAYLYRGREPFAAGLGFFGVLLWWLSIAMIRYGGMPAWQALPTLVLLVAYCATYWALVPRLARAACLVVHPYLAFAAAVLTTDWLRGWVIAAFPWGEWSWAVVRDTPLLQVASLCGAHGLTALVAISGAALADLRIRPVASVSVAALLCVVHLGGAIRLLVGVHDDATLRVGLLQGNVAQDIKNRDLDNATAIRTTYETLTREAQSRGAELVVWPEASWPGRPDPNIPEFPYDTGVPLVIGAATMHHERDHTIVTNSAFTLAAGGAVTGRYDKIALVPFGEYVPMAHILGVTAIVPELGEVTAGRSTEPIGDQKLGALVCYDGIFSAISRDEVAGGARLLVNLTNDAWYDASSGPYQHRDTYRLRAVETGRWVARATNTGVSTIVDPLGRVRESTRFGEEAVLTGDVGLRDTKTLYVLAGDWVLWLALLAVAVGLLRGFGTFVPVRS